MELRKRTTHPESGAQKVLSEPPPSDTYYGTGISISNPQCMQKNNWPGNNMLGIILMDIRKDLSR